ncbi:MAG: hypothetical protein K0R36_1659 [Chryseobacterium sp.]|jgi:hypothetical protein|nr:hypothetical protein [Chryseobacterium sp.]
MKKLFLSLVLFSTIGCNSNDDVIQTNNEASIIGKWHIEKAEIYKSANQQTQTNFSTDCEKKSTHEFKQTNMISITFAQSNNACVQTDLVTRNYTFDKVNMKLWFEGEENYPYFVTSLTQNDMVMEDRTEDIDGDGIKDIIRRFYKKVN